MHHFGDINLMKKQHISKKKRFNLTKIVLNLTKMNHNLTKTVLNLTKAG
jgi:hypothetical protein